MTTFSIYDIPYLRNYHARVQAAHEAARETPSLVMRHTAADSLTLRGIPAVGRGVAGAIPGTNPEAAALR